MKIIPMSSGSMSFETQANAIKMENYWLLDYEETHQQQQHQHGRRKKNRREVWRYYKYFGVVHDCCTCPYASAFQWGFWWIVLWIMWVAFPISSIWRKINLRHWILCRMWCLCCYEMHCLSKSKKQLINSEEVLGAGWCSILYSDRFTYDVNKHYSVSGLIKWNSIWHIRLSKWIILNMHNHGLRCGKWSPCLCKSGVFLKRWNDTSM